VSFLSSVDATAFMAASRNCMSVPAKGGMIAPLVAGIAVDLVSRLVLNEVATPLDQAIVSRRANDRMTRTSRSKPVNDRQSA
jgi:hypothetical protein